jgi:hypothetical protein
MKTVKTAKLHHLAKIWGPKITFLYVSTFNQSKVNKEQFIPPNKLNCIPDATQLDLLIICSCS